MHYESKQESVKAIQYTGLNDQEIIKAFRIKQLPLKVGFHISFGSKNLPIPVNPTDWVYKREDDTISVLNDESFRLLYQEEILNLDYHVKSLVIKALNRYETKVLAAAALGISERHLFNLIEQYDIVRSEVGGSGCRPKIVVYYLKSNKKCST
jgi:hypothetical protein